MPSTKRSTTSGITHVDVNGVEMTPERKRMQRIINRFKHYVATYDSQPGCLDYSDDTFINDMLYGIGVSLRPKRWKWADGYAKFKTFLKGFIGAN